MDDGTPRRRLKKPERRRLIEDAASALFAEHGYAETRLEDIAAGAGVTKQLLYQHFPSKKALHMALLERHRDNLLAGLAEEMQGTDPLAERLPRVLDRWFRYVEEQPYASAMLFKDTTGDPELLAFHRELHASARAANMALLKAEPELDIDDTTLEPIAELVRAAITGLALWWAEHPNVPRATLVAISTDLLAHGLGLTRPPPDRQRRAG